MNILNILIVWCRELKSLNAPQLDRMCRPAKMRRINSCGQIPGLNQDDHDFSLARRGSW